MNCFRCKKDISPNATANPVHLSKETKVAFRLSAKDESEYWDSHLCYECFASHIEELSKEELLDLFYDNAVEHTELKADFAALDEAHSDSEKRLEDVVYEVGQKTENYPYRGDVNSEEVAEYVESALDDAKEESFKEGKSEGYDDGYEKGREEGYKEGQRDYECDCHMSELPAVLEEVS